jgi:urea transport system ATP-binding protein
MLTIKDLSFHYGKSQILYDINLTARKGQVTCVMGTNGVGKTTLMRAIAGVTHASRGAIQLDDQNITAMAAYRRALSGIAYVPQGRGIFPLLSVKENLETGFACLPSDQRVIPESVFQMFPILENMLYRKGGDLSGGQQQQLAVARALITQPKVLILDEPTEGIQPNIIKDIGAVIGNLQSRGDMAIILVEQYFDFAFDLADHFYALRRGKIVMDQSKASVTREQVLSCVSV